METLARFSTSAKLLICSELGLAGHWARHSGHPSPQSYTPALAAPSLTPAQVYEYSASASKAISNPLGQTTS